MGNYLKQVISLERSGLWFLMEVWSIYASAKLNKWMVIERISEEDIIWRRLGWVDQIPNHANLNDS